MGHVAGHVVAAGSPSEGLPTPGQRVAERHHILLPGELTGAGRPTCTLVCFRLPSEVLPWATDQGTPCSRLGGPARRRSWACSAAPQVMTPPVGACIVSLAGRGRSCVCSGGPGSHPPSGRPGWQRLDYILDNWSHICSYLNLRSWLLLRLQC